MSNFETFLDSLPDYAKDLKLNAKSIILSENSTLSETQISMIAIACSIATKNTFFAKIVEEHFVPKLSENEITGAKASAVIMGMNNIYYRFLHLTTNHEYQAMSVGLRMSVIANSGIDNIDFELISLAVSSITGCGLCVDSHEKKLKSHNISSTTIQHAIKIAAVLHGLSFC